MTKKGTYCEGTGGNNLPLELREDLRVNPFNVPQDYFATSASQIISQVKIDELQKQSAGFALPEGYFDGLKDSILSQVRLEKLKEEDEQAIWGVPTDYFASLNEQILAQAVVDTQAKQEDGFEAPSDYFTDLSSRIQASVFQDSLKDEVKSPGFNVPDQYFAKANASIMAAIRQEDSAEQQAEETPVRRIKTRSWIGYAAAACVAVVLSVGGYLSMNNNEPEAMVQNQQVAMTAPALSSMDAPKSSSQPLAMLASEQHLADIPEEEIINYLASSNCSDDMVFFAEYMYQDHDHEHDAQGVCIHVHEEDIKDYLNYML